MAPNGCRSSKAACLIGNDASRKLLLRAGFRQRGLVVERLTPGVVDLELQSAAEAFDGVIKGGCTRLIADLGAVDYTSSAGLRSLLITLKDARKLGGDLRLAAMRPAVQRVMSLSGFTGIFNIYDDVPAALASYNAG